MLYKIGRFLQMTGLFLLPFAMAGNVMEKIDLKTMLVIAGAGILIFSAGWTLQQMGKK